MTAPDTDHAAKIRSSMDVIVVSAAWGNATPEQREGLMAQHTSITDHATALQAVRDEARRRLAAERARSLRLRKAAHDYRYAVKVAKETHIKNGRRGASDSAVAEVNRARDAASLAYHRMMDAIDDLPDNDEGEVTM